MMPKQDHLPACEVIILTALRVERQAVLAYLEEVQEIIHPQGTIYDQGIFRSEKRTWHVAVAEIGMGGPGAAAETERAISFFHPEITLFVGVAGGLKDVQIGDVIAATKVYTYESGKAAQHFEPRPEAWRSSYALEQRARAEIYKEGWLVRLGEHCPSPAPRALVGALAAGEKVVSSKRSSIYRLLQRTYGDALAVEMEGHGFLQAVHANHTVQALVVRGISDRIDNKTEADVAGSQEMAARHAAAFAFEVLAHLASEHGNQQSRFLPETHLEARDITAANAVSGFQYIGEQHIHLPGQKYVPPLDRPWRAEHFQDRVSERAWLLAHLRPGQIVTICGPGGMGKTALVAEILWMLAPGNSPPASFPHGIVFHSFYGRPEAAVALEQLARTFGEDPLPTPAQAAQRALSGKQVLLVLDGAEEAEHLEQVLAVCASCAVLVTSQRRSDAAHPALLLDLQQLPPEDAVAVVQAWQVQRQAKAVVIERIVQLIGGFPLALSLVGSYLALHPDEADDYLAWLEEDLFEALNQGSTTRKSVPLLLDRSVACLSPDAQSVLRVIGMLALAPFGRELVSGILELAPRAASRALGTLMNYGLLVQVETGYEVSHPLIHSYARQVLLAQQEETHQHVLVERLVTVLAEHFPEVEYTNWARCEQLVPHIQACTSQLEQQRAFLAEAASISHQAGDYLLARARYEQAEELFKRALALREQVLEPDHIAISQSMDRLATLYQYQGKYEQAEPLFQRSLAINEQALPPDHPDTAIALENYATLLREMNRPHEAQTLAQRAKAIRARRSSQNTT